MAAAFANLPGKVGMLLQRGENCWEGGGMTAVLRAFCSSEMVGAGAVGGW